MYYRALLKWKPYQKCYNCWKFLVSFIKWQESLSPGKAERAWTVCFANCLSSPQSHSAQCFTLLENTQSTFLFLSFQCRNHKKPKRNLIMIKVTIPEKWAAWNSLKKTVWLLDLGFSQSWGLLFFLLLPTPCLLFSFTLPLSSSILLALVRSPMWLGSRLDQLFRENGLPENCHMGPASLICIKKINWVIYEETTASIMNFSGFVLFSMTFLRNQVWVFKNKRACDQCVC